MPSPQTLPSHARCVFQGNTYQVWQWEQVMYDGSIKIFEAIKRPGTVSLIATVGERIMIQHQTQPHRSPFLSLPGGRCDEGEDHAQAAARELLEETGTVPARLEFWQTIPSPYSTIIRASHYYIAKDCQEAQELQLDNGERITNTLITFQEFLLLSENPLFRDADLSRVLLQIRLDSQKVEELKGRLFE